MIGLYSVTISAVNTKSTIEDQIELNQQLEEIKCQIKKYIEESYKIISITTTQNLTIKNLEIGQLYNISSIKLDLKNSDGDEDLKNKNNSEKNREIKLKNNKKIFINTLKSDNSNESGGEEIGDYVESINIKLKSSKLVCITLNLKKNKASLKKEIDILIKYDYLKKTL